MSGRRAFAIGALLLIGLSLGGCGAHDDAAGMVSKWLTALESGSGDRGWGLLHPETRKNQYHDEASLYTDRVSHSEWASFEWSIGSTISEDGGTYVVIVDTPDTGRAPQFLFDDHLVQLVPRGNGVNVLGVIVVFAEGRSGIWLSPK